MDPIVSVIIISYNCAEYISKAIESCLSQSCKNIEIIIGDDGSTDNSKDVIDEYISKYPKVIKCYIMERPSDERNIIPSIRVSKNIKRALQYAKGKYIRVMSADDYYEDKFLFEKQLKILEANNEYSSVTCGYRKVWPDGKNEEYYPPRNINSIFWSGMYVHVSCLLIRQEVLKGRYLLPRLCDDTGLLYSAIISGKCLGMPSIGFVYRQRMGSIMHKADLMELALLELMLFQDVLKVGGCTISSISRFSWPLNYVVSNIDKLKNKKYEKYIKEMGDGGFICMILENKSQGLVYKSLRFVLCYISRLVAFFMKILRYLYYGGNND